MKKTLALLLALVMIFTACGTLAETATVTEEPYAVLMGLLSAFEENPFEGKWFEDVEEANEYCLKIYNYIDPEKVGSVFYGGPDEAAFMMKRLNAALWPEDSSFSDMGLESGELFYVFVWELLHMDSTSQGKSRPVIKETMKGVFEGYPEDAISTAVDDCFEYIGMYEPEIANSAYTMNADNERTVNGSEEYFQYYTEGYQLFDEGKYAEAIESYKKCLELQENDPLATFEIIESYIALRDYESAKTWLAQIAPYLEGDEYKAQWFRRQGYIAIEEMDYQLAYAFYVYSQVYEKSDLAEQEMDYIRYVYTDVQQFTEEEARAYLEEKGV